MTYTIATNFSNEVAISAFSHSLMEGLNYFKQLPKTFTELYANTEAQI